VTSSAQRRLAGTGLALAVGAAIAFLALPLVALLTRVTPAEVLHELSIPETRTTLMISIGAVACALVLILLIGTPLAYLLARGRQSRWLAAADTIVDLPLVLPPAVAGIALLATFGNGGLFGDALTDAGLIVPFTRVAVVLALAFVAAPLFIRQAQAAFAAATEETVDAMRTLPPGPLTRFLRVELPLARRGIASGISLAAARALGEFGATIVFAGSVAGVTQTLTLAIYGNLGQDAQAAYALAVTLLLLTLCAALASRWFRVRSDWAAQ
jgi:molybdate transport system permease protein